MKDRGTGAGGRPHTESPESPRSGMRKPGARLHADGEAVRWRARGRLTGRAHAGPRQVAGGGAVRAALTATRDRRGRTAGRPVKRNTQRRRGPARLRTPLGAPRSQHRARGTETAQTHTPSGSRAPPSPVRGAQRSEFKGIRCKPSMPRSRKHTHSPRRGALEKRRGHRPRPLETPTLEERLIK